MAELTDAQKEILAYTLLGEAAGEGRRGMEAVMHVIVNRAESGRYPENPANVALQPFQFSTWNSVNQGGNDPISHYSRNSSSFKTALSVVNKVLSGNSPDPTGGATHYYARTIAQPYWFDEEAKAGAVRIGNHIFAARQQPGAPTPARRPVSLEARDEMAARAQRAIAYAAPPAPATRGQNKAPIPAAPPSLQVALSRVPGGIVTYDMGIYPKIQAQNTKGEILVGRVVQDPIKGGLFAVWKSKGVTQSITKVDTEYVRPDGTVTKVPRTGGAALGGGTNSWDQMRTMIMFPPPPDPINRKLYGEVDAILNKPAPLSIPASFSHGAVLPFAAWRAQPQRAAVPEAQPRPMFGPSPPAGFFKQVQQFNNLAANPFGRMVLENQFYFQDHPPPATNMKTIYGTTSNFAHTDPSGSASGGSIANDQHSASYTGNDPTYITYDQWVAGGQKPNQLVVDQNGMHRQSRAGGKLI